MKTVALRFSENFAPECGTIAAHQKVINEYGYVWYGKLGLPLSEKYVEEMRKEDDLRILLIQSSKQNRYWAKVACMQKEAPPFPHPLLFCSFSCFFLQSLHLFDGCPLTPNLLQNQDLVYQFNSFDFTSLILLLSN